LEVAHELLNENADLVDELLYKVCKEILNYVHENNRDIYLLKPLNKVISDLLIKTIHLFCNFYNIFLKQAFHFPTHQNINFSVNSCLYPYLVITHHKNIVQAAPYLVSNKLSNENSFQFSSNEGGKGWQEGGWDPNVTWPGSPSRITCQ
jgi:hypothetical protein